MKVNREFVFMAIELTEQQQQDLDAIRENPPRVVDPRTRKAFVLIPEGEYELVHEALEEDRKQRAIHAIGRRNAIGRMDQEP